MVRRPTNDLLAADHPLAVRLRQTPAVRLSHAVAPDGSPDPATDAMIALGGEAATSLGDDGQLSGLLVLGPKRSGMPYEDEEMAFLAALELGRHARPALGRHPADARIAQSRAARQGRKDHRATAADLDPSRPAPRPGRARARWCRHGRRQAVSRARLRGT